MKKDILKAAGVESEEALYKKYPTEEAFRAAHPAFANKMRMGGTREAFPQTATMDNFFSYGVPAPPNYLAHGGMPNAFPQAQTESQFFIPIYTDVYNPYNKAAGGSMPEMFPQVGKVEYQPPANMWFEQGGEQEEPVGVQNRLGKFMAQIGERAAAAANKQVGQSAMGIMRDGGNLRQYDPGGQITPDQLAQLKTAYADISRRYPNLDPQELTARAYSELYGTMPSTDVAAGFMADPNYKAIYDMYSSAGAGTGSRQAGSKYDLNQLAINSTPYGRGPIKSKGYVNGEFGRGRNDQYMWQSMFNTDNFAEAQRLAAETGLRIDEGKAGLLGRRNKYTYNWGNTPGAGAAPGTTGTASGTQPGAPQNSNMDDPNMGFMERMFYKQGNKYIPNSNIQANPELGQRPEDFTMQSNFDPTGYNSDFSGMRNQIFQNRKRRTGEKLDDLYYRQEAADRANMPYFTGRDERRMDRLENRFNRIGPKSGYGFNQYVAPNVMGENNTSAPASSPANVQTSQAGNTKSFAQSSSYAPTTLAGYVAPGNVSANDTPQNPSNLYSSSSMMFSPDDVAGDAPENPMDYGQSTMQYQAPSNANSMDPNVARKKASYMPKTTSQLVQYAPNDYVGEIPESPAGYYNPALAYNPDDYIQGDVNLAIPSQAYGGVPMARWGLNKNDNRVIEKDSWWNRTAEDYGGPENFYQRQMKKGIFTNLLNMNDPEYRMSNEDMYDAPGTKRGTFAVLSGTNTEALNRVPAVKDAFTRGYKTGGNYKKGDVTYWDEDTINAFIQAGGQVEYLD